MALEQKTAFVTGGTGKIGLVLVDRLVHSGFFVKVLTRRQDNPWTNVNNVKIIRGNIMDKGIIKEAIQGCDYIFHLAVYQNISDSKKDLFEKINVEGTKTILDCVVNFGVKKIVYVSTAAVFKPTGKIERNEEWLQRNSCSHEYYLQTKIEALKLVREMKKNLPIVVVYPTAVIDFKDFSSSAPVQSVSLQRFLWEKIGGGIPGGFMNLIGAGNRVFNYVAVEDLVEGIILAAMFGRIGEEYILGGYNVTSRNYLCATSRRLNKHPFPFRIPVLLFKIIALAGWLIPLPTMIRLIAKEPPGDLCLSSEKAKKDLKYNPKMKLI